MIIQNRTKKDGKLIFCCLTNYKCRTHASFVLPSYVQASLRQRAPFFPYRSETALFLLALTGVFAGDSLPPAYPYA